MAGEFEVGAPTQPVPIIDPRGPGAAGLPIPTTGPTRPADLMAGMEPPVRELPTQLPDVHGPPDHVLRQFTGQIPQDSPPPPPPADIPTPATPAAPRSPSFDVFGVKPDQLKPAVVTFILDAGRFMTSYPLVILANNVIVLGYAELPVGAAIFQPAPSNNLLLEIDNRQFRVMAGNWQFDLGRFHMTMYPIVPQIAGDQV